MRGFALGLGPPRPSIAPFVERKFSRLTPRLNAAPEQQPPQLRPPLQIHITPHLHVSAANTHLWYPAAGTRSNKIRTAGADERTGQQRVSPLHPKAGGTRDKLG